MKYLTRAAAAAMLMITLGATAAEAQRATISPSSARGTEAENVMFTVSGTWAYDAEIEYFTEDISATAGDDYQSESWTFCFEGENDLDGASDGCEFGSGSQSQPLWVVHYTDDDRESDETYRVVARVLRWETGALDADGLPVVRECGGSSCGRATATGTIIDDTPDPEPELPGWVEFADTYTSVTEGGTVELLVSISPSEQGSSYPASSAEWSTADNGGAVGGRDYQASSGTVNLPGCATGCGTQTRSIRIRTLQDKVEEPSEEFTVSLSNPRNATLGRRATVAFVTIEDDDENSPPYVNLTAERTRVRAGDRIKLESNAEDKEGPVTIQWSGAGGWDSHTRRWVRWTAPSPPEESTYTLTVTVTDDDGAVSTGSIDITVAGRGADNQSPTVTLAANASEVNEGSSITLTATAADSDGSIRRYEWSGNGTFGSGTDERTWTAPAVDRDTDHTLSVTVTDNEGATATDSVSVRVIANHAPTVSLAASAYEVEAGAEVTLTATAADSDGTIASYAWSGANLSATDTTAEVTWTAPRPADETAYTLRVTVTDDDGDTATDTVHMTVAARPPPPPPPNNPPTVTFWPVSSTDQELNGGEEARLAADGLDRDNDTLTYEWSAPVGTFDHENFFVGLLGGVIDWTAPRLAEKTTVTITVTVTDGRGGSASDTVDIVVLAHSTPNIAPQVTVTASEPGDTIDPEDLVSFTVSATDTGTLTYEWSGGGDGFGDVGTDGSVDWRAPVTETETAYTLVLTVTDDEGLATTWASDVYTVSGTPAAPPPPPPANVLPTIRLSAAPPRVVAGGEVTMEAQISDSDGTIESETWPDGSRNIRSVGSSRVAEWRAPADAAVGSTHTLTVSVTDDRDGTASASVTITIIEQPAGTNAAPTVDVEASALRVAASGTVSLTATATDSDGTIEAYEWSGSGTFTARGTGARQDWTAPAPADTTDYELTVTVTDDDGAEDSASVTVTVIGTTNVAPTVELSADPSTARVGGGGKVVLTAVAEDRNGTITDYTWSEALLDGTSSSEGRFELWTTEGKTDWYAPNPTTVTVYTLTVTVTDNHDATATDSVDITVDPAAEPEPEPEALPIVTFDSTQVAEGTTGSIQVTLDKAAPAGASIRYEVGDSTEGYTDSQRCRDYRHAAGTLDLAGKTSATIPIEAHADTCLEGGEDITVRIYDPAKVRLDFDTVSVRILNRSASIQFVIPSDGFEPNADPDLEPTVVNAPRNEGTGFDVEITRTGDTGVLSVESTVEVHLEGHGGAVPGEDFEAGPFTVTFRANDKSATLSVQVHHDDSYGEPGEWFRLELKNATGAVIGSPHTVDFDIVDQTETPRKIIFSMTTPTPTVTEGETARCEVHVREVEGRALDAAPQVFFEITKANGGPVIDIDYTPTADKTWLQFGTGADQTRTIEIPTYRTQANSGERMRFNCNLASDVEDTAGGYRYDGDYALEVDGDQRQVTVFIANIPVTEADTDPAADDRGPTWADNQTVTERDGSVSFDLRLNGSLPEVSGEQVALRVNWETSDDDDGATAVEGTDYTANSGTFTFSPGGSTSQRITVNVNCDDADEIDEHFFVTATAHETGGAALSGRGTSKVRITIKSEDGHCGGFARALTIEDAPDAKEGEPLVFTVRLPQAWDVRAWFRYTTEDGTAKAGDDYTADTDSDSIPAGEASITIEVPTLEDSVRDERETVRVRIYEAFIFNTDQALGIANAVATGTIIDAGTIGAEFVNVPSRHAQLPFTAELHFTAPLAAGTTAADVANAVTVETHDMTDVAVSAVKLRAMVYRLTITPTGGGNLAIGLDTTALTGSDSRGIEVTPVIVHGRVVANVSDGEARETDTWLGFTVALTGTMDVRAQVDWATTTAADDDAVAGRDYQAASGTLTFEPGETEKTARVRLFRTTEDEEDETFTVSLSNPRPVTQLVVGDSGTMTIHDGSLGVEIQQPATARTDDSNFMVPLRFRPGVSASVDADAVKNVLRILDDGACSASVAGVTSAGDNKNFTAEINPGGECHIEIGILEGTTLGDAVMQYTARAWILGPGGFSVEILDAEATEGDDTHIRFTARLNGPPRESLTVDYATIDGTGDDAASAGSDYTAKSGTLTFNPTQRQGRPELVIEVPLRDDRTLEGTNEDPAERFSITLSNPSAGLSISDASATGTIHENDQAAWFTQSGSRGGDGDFSIRVWFRVTDETIDTDALLRALQLSAGTFTRIYAETRGKTYVVDVDPPDERHIEIRLPRGTRVGRHTTLSDARYWALGPLHLAVADAQGTEGPNEVVRFAVRLSQAAREPVTVDYATEDFTAAGTARAGEDYTATSGTLTFAVGETLKHVDVPILDDDVDEEDETFKLRLKNAFGAGIIDSTGVGTIQNHDELPIALIARFGRATASQIVDQVETRIEGPPRTEGIDVKLDSPWMEPTIGGTGRAAVGHSTRAGAADGSDFSRVAHAPMGAGRPGSSRRRRPSDDDPLGRSSFALNGQGAGGTFAIWSQSAQTSFSGRQAGIALRGDVHTRTIGADYARGKLMTGVAVGHTRAGGDYEGVSTGEVTTSLTGLYPWFGYRATENLTLWVVGGRAGGAMLLTRPESGPTRTSTSMTMIAGGGRNRIGRTRTMDLAVKADVLWVGTAIDGVVTSNGRLSGASAAVTRIRAGLEGARTYTLGRFSVRPAIETAFRQDGGDAETGSGIDAGAGIDVADTASGFGASIHLRRLLLHQADGFEEQGVSFTMTYDPSPATPLGLRAEVTPSWGAQATGGARALWSGDTLRYRNGGGQGQGRSVDGRIGYGVRHGSRLVGTPRVGLRSSEYGRNWLVGYGLELLESGRLNFQLDIDAERRESGGIDGAENGIVGRATLGWD